ncbi:UNVERIFIED_CONTAM: GDP-L-fucose synthetase [Hammondia hammondi]|eukprot:XP_008884126.1 GDP-L-fucose synthetase [Hammondia hammondi]
MQKKSGGAQASAREARQAASGLLRKQLCRQEESGTDKVFNKERELPRRSKGIELLRRNSSQPSPHSATTSQGAWWRLFPSQADSMAGDLVSPSLPVCLVTGGSGLVGKALQSILLREQAPSSSSSSSSPSSSSASSSSSSSSSASSSSSSSSSPSGCEGRDGGAVRGEASPEGPTIISARGVAFVFVGSRHADLRDYRQTETLFLRYRPQSLIHLAARVGGLFDNTAHNLEFFQDNVRINDNVVRVAHLLQVGKAVFCLSTCIFPAHYAESGECLVEEHLHNGAPHPSNEGYSYAKRMLEVAVRLHRQRYGHQWRCVVPTNLYGPFDQFSLEKAHVLPALIYKAFVASQENTALVVGGSGSPLRQFLYSEDAAEILLRVLEAPALSEEESLMILASDTDTSEEASIAYIAQRIADAFHLSKPLEFDRSRPDGIYRKPVSTARLRRFLGPDFRFVSLEEGIQRTVQWFIQNSKSART